ncbi:hypothetical protein FJTKL_10970 [Diaporthe vaccinii]|uniref:Uncharacterized protein n=1 Tax=Diaporthe vaccinii TaxID=105482 RepID=A0ABR4EIU9_9PEZI
MDFDPGTDTFYSDYGTMPLSYLVTNTTGMPYLENPKEHVLDGLYVQLYETAAEKHAEYRIVQESTFTGYDPTAPGTTNLVPSTYGGDGAMNSFSLAASASTITRLIGRHAVLETGRRAACVQRDRSLAEARTFASSAQLEANWVLNLDTYEFISDADFDDLRFFKLTRVFTDHPVVAT